MEKINIKSDNLDEVVKALLYFRGHELSVYCEFKDHILYSDNITIDSAYLQVYGKTKAEWEKWQQEIQEMNESKQQRAARKIPEWIEQCKPYIYPQRLNQLEKWIESSANGFYSGMDINASLKVMKDLNDGIPFDIVYRKLDQQDYSGTLLTAILGFVITFSKKGPQFYEAEVERLLPEYKSYVDKQKKLNARYERELAGELIQ